jgi:hypothetical protein
MVGLVATAPYLSVDENGQRQMQTAEFLSRGDAVSNYQRVASLIDDDELRGLAIAFYVDAQAVVQAVGRGYADAQCLQVLDQALITMDRVQVASRESLHTKL